MAFKDDVISGFGQGLAGSVFGGLSSILGHFFAKDQAKQQFELQKQENEQVFQQNKELAAYQNSLNLAQWKRENAYNTPAAQMARYAAAGLNPDLIYGQQNTASSSPQLIGGTPKQSANAAEARNAATQSMASLQNIFAQNALLHAQKENVEADTDNKKADTDNKEEDTKGKKISNTINGATIKQQILGYDLTNQEMEATIDKLVSAKELDKQLAQESKKRIYKIDEEIANFDYYRRQMEQKLEYMNEQRRTEIVKQQHYLSEISKFASEVHRNNNMAYYYQQKGITEKDVRDNLQALSNKYIIEGKFTEEQFEQLKALFPFAKKEKENQLHIQEASADKLEQEKKNLQYDITSDGLKHMETAATLMMQWQSLLLRILQ